MEINWVEALAEIKNQEKARIVTYLINGIRNEKYGSDQTMGVLLPGGNLDVMVNAMVDQVYAALATLKQMHDDF